MSKDNSESQSDDFEPPVLKLLEDPASPEWRRNLLKAKARGSSDQTAAEFAGLNEDQFHEKLQQDPALERDMRAVRAGALLRHLRKIGSVSQWQAHEFLLEKLWAEAFSDAPVKSAAETEAETSVRRVARGLSPDQLGRPAALIGLGAEREAEIERIKETQENSTCQTCETDSSEPSPASSPSNELPAVKRN